MTTIADIKRIAVAASFEGELWVQITKRADDFTSKQSKPFILLELADASGSETVRIWGDSRAYAQCIELNLRPGAFIRISGGFGVNDFGMTLKSPSLDLLTPMEEAELLAGGEKQSRRNLELWLELKSHFEGHEENEGRSDPSYKLPALDAFALWVMERFEAPLRRSAAARGNHHARRGGLLEHVVSMMAVAHTVSGCYPEICAPLLKCGVLFHDLAKIYENDFDPKGFKQRPTLRGHLLGHIPLGHEMLAALWAEHFGQQWPELRDHLIHLVLCHHGMKEWGSPQEPMTIEGFALHYIDMIDARVEILRESFRNPDTIPGICDAKKPLYQSVARPWKFSAEAEAMQREAEAQKELPLA